jgi:FkbM family methyltransferase
VSFLNRLKKAKKFLFPDNKPDNTVEALFRQLDSKGAISKNKLVKKGDTVMHLGVWRVETIQQWSELVGLAGKVVIVEADDLNHMINEVEVKRRAFNNVTLVNKGIWNKKETITLQVSDVSMRNKIKEARTEDRLNPDSNFQKEKHIQGDTVDNILKELGITKVNHIFMTISGAEIEALEGMKETIANNNDLTLYMRCTLLNEATRKPNSEVVVEYLTKIGFTARAARKEHNRDGSNVFAVRISGR